MSVLTDYRVSVATILRENLPDEIAVIDHIPDSIAPPVIVWGWASPWVLPNTWCQFSTTAEIICVSQRIEPGGHLGVLESMVEMVLDILSSNRIALRDVTAPYPIVLGGVNYLATSVNIVQELGD